MTSPFESRLTQIQARYTRINRAIATELGETVSDDRINLEAVRRDITRANDPEVGGEGLRVVLSRVVYAASALESEVRSLRAALDEANTDRHRLAEQLALRDQACILGGQEVIYERTRADRAVAQIQRIEEWRDQLSVSLGGWDAEIAEHLTKLLTNPTGHGHAWDDRDGFCIDGECRAHVSDLACQDNGASDGA